jgi:hypothetical protein
MLSSDWAAWVGKDCPPDFAHRIAQMRSLITHRTLDPTRPPKPTFRLLDRVLGLYWASEARMQLHRLHRLCEEFATGEIQSNDGAVQSIRTQLRDLSANMGDNNVRYFAFNIVSDRHRLHIPMTDELPKLREEPAGMSIPCLYLSSLLFDLDLNG